MKEFSTILENEEATVAMGNHIAQSLSQGMTIFLHGDLGAGKTTLSRGIIQGLGHNGRVKSPTYTLVEPYELENISAYHFDLYRLADPEELEFMGFRDYFNDKALCLIEWPEKGQAFLPKADLELYLTYADEQREIRFQALSEIGEQTVLKIESKY
ncbi:tRNA (adenosine(37)-N6)-threonylcarbamoyltransferase complex ATPase subunit type 1 TsaE [Psychrosphaera haliotis]|mgnify:CR=1 FL=1|uniref:tRNA threonylcarbamoyladenosine biosynthesis protein TsaE n=1 Tax=Psychrosphaera haliotis TaxID=555083 RepID=A0A6N8FDP1_9GAMM|nr:tRNA (adenosine(37)-N6)-threonylcarbamoyltransferase complex ATPase subunit type 1 TsaE [Psychrosphaera haliotis]MUH72852.1 tRNA (adenosine(37)-N6)-threonylcarbamoyltransferase complex ATPase subunit type 1 TsaE [Psychrosphaera haliotis]